MTNKIGPDHYRYFATLDENGVHIKCVRFVVIGETERCWYVLPESRAYMLGQSWAAERVKKLRKRVLKSSHGRRYCYPDKARALDSFARRQRFRLSHVKRSMSIAELAGKEAERLLDAKQLPDENSWYGHPCGHASYTASLTWSKW